MTYSIVRHSARLHLLEGLTFIPVEEGVLIDGLAHLEIIKGPVAQTLLPTLLNMLDGQHTVNTIVAAFSTTTPSTIISALKLLESWGVLAEETTKMDVDTAYVNRTMLSRGVTPTPSILFQNIKAASITIVAAPCLARYAELLCDILRASGIEANFPMELAEARAPRTGAISLAVALVTSTEDSVARHCEEARLSGGCQWIRVAMSADGETADIGPIFNSSFVTCYECFRRVQVPQDGRDKTSEFVDPSHANVLIGFAALQIMSLITTPDYALQNREFRRYALPYWTCAVLMYPRAPGCSSVAKVKREMGSDARDCHLRSLWTAEVFEQYLGPGSPKGRLYTPALAAQHAGFGKESKVFRNCERVDQTDFVISKEARLHADSREVKKRKGLCITAEELIAILTLAAGARDVDSSGVVRRWAATAGNLGSPELFVVAHTISGLSSGTYLYNAIDHSLRRFHRGEGTILDFSCEVLGTGNSPDAVVIFTGAYHRLEQKYGPFGYRLLHMDAGVAYSQMTTVLRALGLFSRALTCIHIAHTEEALVLREFEEQVTTCVMISARPLPSRPDCSTRCPASSKMRSYHPPEYFHSLSAAEITAQLYRESMCKAASDASNSYHYNSVSTEPAILSSVNHTDRKPVLRLPRSFGGNDSLAYALQNRHSVRRFKERPVPLATLSAALKYAHESDLTEYPEEHSHSLPLCFRILAVRVEGLARGVYGYDPDSHAVHLINSELGDVEFRSLFAQHEVDNPPCAIWLSGDLARSLALYGSFAHRTWLMRGGAAANRLWMEIVSHGFSGTLVAGIVAGETWSRLSKNRATDIELLALVLGKE